MPDSLLNPEGHVQVPLYHHVAIARRSKQIYLAGQVSRNADGNLVAAGVTAVIA